MFWWRKQPEPTPIADTVQVAAELLGVKVTRETPGFLALAMVLHELARRIVALEAKDR